MRNAATYIRRELMIRLVRAFDQGTLAEELDHIPLKLRPKGSESSRYCIYHDRAVLKYRLMALLGICVEDEEDEAKPLKDYLADRLASADHGGDKARAVPLSVCGPACSGCPRRQGHLHAELPRLLCAAVRLQLPEEGDLRR